MPEHEVRSMCEKTGCRLLQYKEAHSAMMILSNGDSIIVYIDETTIELFTKRFLVGWNIPRCIGSWNFFEMDSNWLNIIPLTRTLISSFTLDCMIEQIAQCKSIKDTVTRVKMGTFDPLKYAQSKLDVMLQKVKSDEQ